MGKEMWPGMSRKRFKVLGKHIRELANMMGLRDWMVLMMHTPANVYLANQGQDSCNIAACVHLVKGRKECHIYLGQDFNTYSRDFQRHALVHELIHVHVDQIRFHVETCLKSMIGAQAWIPFHEGLFNLNETIVDGIAAEWAEYLPLPPKDKS